MAHATVRTFVRLGALLAVVLALSGCNGVLDGPAKATQPVPQRLKYAMKAKGMAERAPIMMRIFKEESELEVWKAKANGRYALLATYDICKWSGKLGPKHREGDRQAPEGFYSVARHQMNPHSKYYLAFNLGFPNRFDRAHGRTGTHLMVHGDCSSAGCYSMTDPQMAEIYALAREAHAGGQKAFQVQALPFRMSATNMAKHKDHQDFAFWQTLKRGHDLFELTKRPPKVDVCARNYQFETRSDGAYRADAACPPMTMSASLAASYLSKVKADRAQLAKLVGEETAAALAPIEATKALPGVTLAPARTIVPEPAQPAQRAKPRTEAPEAPASNTDETVAASMAPAERPSDAKAPAGSNSAGTQTAAATGTATD